MDIRPTTLTSAPLALLLLASAGLAPLASAALAQSDSPSTPQTVSGSVLDGASNQPVFRALVRLGSRAVLTDSEGRFTFPQVDPATLSISALKPGYSFAQEPGDPTQTTLQPDALAHAILLRLYPDAILQGRVISGTGEPLVNIEVIAHRSSFGANGHHWSNAALTHTNARGAYRFTVPAGDYRLESSFSHTTDNAAILPAALPQSDPAFHVHSGDQLTLDLHPTSAPLLELHAQVNLHNLEDLTAITTAGTSFPVDVDSANGQQISLALPPGRYTLESREGDGERAIQQAVVAVSTAQTQPIDVTLNFQPVAPLAIDIRLDDAAIAAATTAGQTLQPPNPRLLGLTLEPTQSNVAADPVRPRDRDRVPSFLAPPGTYRLRANLARTWYITSATSGGTDLLTHDLLVSGASSPIEITVSNQVASLTGATALNGQPAPCWVFLFASSATATPLIVVHANTDGTFNAAGVPPGSYRAIAFEHRRSLDPADPNVLGPFTTRIASVTLAPTAKTQLNLEVVPDSESQP